MPAGRATMAIPKSEEIIVIILLEYAGINRDVADPWYTDDFEATWQDVLKGCKALLEIISPNQRKSGKI